MCADIDASSPSHGSRASATAVTARSSADGSSRSISALKGDPSTIPLRGVARGNAGGPLDRLKLDLVEAGFPQIPFDGRGVGVAEWSAFHVSRVVQKTGSRPPLPPPSGSDLDPGH